jgi:glyoxylase-like metal-dependent hydrolase (beta-lactamase superfamily II)
MFKKIFPNVFAFISKDEGSNCFVLKGTKKIALIDSTSFFNKKQLLAGLAKLAISKKDRLLILHTHGHADHIGCDEFFPNAKIAMHKADAKLINGKNEEFACTKFFPGTMLPKVSSTLRHNQKIDLGGIALKVIHSPGHTKGSVCFLLEKENALFSGDTLFAEGFGRTDLMGGNSKKMVESLKKLQKMPLKALLPGHGPVLLGQRPIGKAIERSIELASTNAFL